MHHDHFISFLFWQSQMVNRFPFPPSFLPSFLPSFHPSFSTSVLSLTRSEVLSYLPARPTAFLLSSLPRVPRLGLRAYAACRNWLNIYFIEAQFSELPAPRPPLAAILTLDVAWSTDKCLSLCPSAGGVGIRDSWHAQPWSVENRNATRASLQQ